MPNMFFQVLFISRISELGRFCFAGPVAGRMLLFVLALWCIGTQQAAAYTLPDTGQTKCYDNTQEIPCPKPGEPFYGQDGNYQGQQHAYHDNEDGTVTDLNTGLMWQQGDEYNQNPIYHAWPGALYYCDHLDLAGYSDWRLPTRHELLSIVDRGRWDPAINTDYFPACGRDPSLSYWSSSTYAWDPANYVWTVCFYSGRILFATKYMGLYIRCVRGGP